MLPACPAGHGSVCVSAAGCGAVHVCGDDVQVFVVVAAPGTHVVALQTNGRVIVMLPVWPAGQLCTCVCGEGCGVVHVPDGVSDGVPRGFAGSNGLLPATGRTLSMAYGGTPVMRSRQRARHAASCASNCGKSLTRLARLARASPRCRVRSVSAAFSVSRSFCSGAISSRIFETSRRARVCCSRMVPSGAVVVTSTLPSGCVMAVVVTPVV